MVGDYMQLVVDSDAYKYGLLAQVRFWFLLSFQTLMGPVFA